jgi:RNA polymerase sigma-70 factor, ECF subfamily
MTERQHSDLAFADVAERVAPRLFRIGVRMCGSAAEAEDLVQDTLLQGFLKWRQFEGRSDPATWLYTIAGRLCQRRHRRRAGEPTRMESLSALSPSPGDPIVALPAAGEGPLDEHLRKDAEQAVSKALAQLPPHVRLPLVLADIAELSTSEVARILALKEATVKTRVHRARLILRRALLERLPVRPAPPPDHDRQMCLDLLQTKQDAMDRRVPFPFSTEELCARCRSVFATLDLGRATCVNLGRGQLPPALRELIERHRESGTTPASRRPRRQR